MDIPCRDQLGGLSRFSADERFMYDATIYTYDAPSCLPKFTGKERDTESGLDNFGKRYHGGLAHPLGPFPTEGCPTLCGFQRVGTTDPESQASPQPDECEVPPLRKA